MPPTISIYTRRVYRNWSSLLDHRHIKNYGMRYQGGITDSRFQLFMIKWSSRRMLISRKSRTVVLFLASMDKEVFPFHALKVNQSLLSLFIEHKLGIIKGSYSLWRNYGWCLRVQSCPFHNVLWVLVNCPLKKLLHLVGNTPCITSIGIPESQMKFFSVYSQIEPRHKIPTCVYLGLLRR